MKRTWEVSIFGILQISEIIYLILIAMNFPISESRKLRMILYSVSDLMLYLDYVVLKQHGTLAMHCITD